MCCACPPPPPAPALTAICADPGGEERSLCPASAQRKDIIYCHRGTRGHGGIQPSAAVREREREQVAEKDVLCPQQSKKRVIFSGLDNWASVGPCPYYYTSKACLHWVWYCLDFSTATIVDHAELCKEVLAFPLSPSSLPHFICFSPFQVSFSKNHQKGFLFGCWGRFPLTVVR